MDIELTRELLKYCIRIIFECYKNGALSFDDIYNMFDIRIKSDK